jgi:hypothetical protein
MTACNLVGGVMMVNFLYANTALDIVHYLRNDVQLYIEPNPSSQYRSEDNFVNLVWKYID